VTIILRGHDNSLATCSYRRLIKTGGRLGLPVCEVNMKLLPATLLLALINLGCGGYGSGMGTTPAPMPQIAPNTGTFSTPLTVTITDQLQNTVIYVTTDGSTPTLNSRIYSGPFMLTQAGQVQVQAIAVAGGYKTSQVAIANFTLQ